MLFKSDNGCIDRKDLVLRSTSYTYAQHTIKVLSSNNVEAVVADSLDFRYHHREVFRLTTIVISPTKQLKYKYG
jgi:hypothetical protein